jgi:hypothetical protein
MRKLFYLSAALLLAVTVFAAAPASAIIPTCYNLPKSNYADPTWTYSHQCREGTQIWYVYIDSLGRWHLVSTTIMP